MDQTEFMGIWAYHSLALMRLAKATQLANQLDDATAVAQPALQLSRDRSCRSVVSPLDWGYPVASLFCSRRCCFQRLWPVQGVATGMLPLVAYFHLGPSKQYGRTSPCEQAQEHLTTATTLSGETDMRFWLEQAETETKGLRETRRPVPQATSSQLRRTSGALRSDAGVPSIGSRIVS